jgi:N4-gp56 family major capsid protein
MANFEWTFDAPSGVYKNFSLSAELRSAAVAESKFMQFVRPESGYGRKSGESITIARVSALAIPTSGKLTEGFKIPEDNLTISSVSITVSEWGRAVPYTSLSEDLSKFDMESIVQQELMKQMRLILDNATAAAFKTCKIKARSTSVSAVAFDTAGSFGGTATNQLDVAHVEQIRDYMYKDLLIPAYEGDDYICLLSTKAKRGLLSDPAWEDWHKYTDPQSKYNGEIGRIENIRFIETNNNNALSNASGSNSIGEAVFFGSDGVVMAVALDPELRAGIPGDFGRQKAVAWYGIMDFGLVWDTANAGEAKVVHFGSA